MFPSFVFASLRKDIGTEVDKASVETAYDAGECCGKDCKVTPEKRFTHHPFTPLGCDPMYDCCMAIYKSGHRWFAGEHQDECTSTNHAWAFVADYNQWTHPGLSAGFQVNTRSSSKRAINMCNSFIYDWETANTNVPGPTFAKVFLWFFMMHTYMPAAAPEADQRTMTIQDHISDFQIEQFWEKSHWNQNCDGHFDDRNQPHAAEYFAHPPTQFYRQIALCMYVRGLSYAEVFTCDGLQTCLQNFNPNPDFPTGFKDTSRLGLGMMWKRVDPVDTATIDDPDLAGKLGGQLAINESKTLSVNGSTPGTVKYVKHKPVGLTLDSIVKSDNQYFKPEVDDDVCTVDFNERAGKMFHVGNESALEPNWLHFLGLDAASISDEHNPEMCTTEILLPSKKRVEVDVENARFAAWPQMTRFQVELPMWGAYGFGAHVFHRKCVRGFGTYDVIDTSDSCWGGINWPATEDIKGMVCDPTCPSVEGGYRCGEPPEGCERLEDNPNFCRFRRGYFFELKMQQLQNNFNNTQL